MKYDGKDASKCAMRGLRGNALTPPLCKGHLKNSSHGEKTPCCLIRASRKENSRERYCLENDGFAVAVRCGIADHAAARVLRGGRRRCPAQHRDGLPGIRHRYGDGRRKPDGSRKPGRYRYRPDSGNRYIRRRAGDAARPPHGGGDTLGQSGWGRLPARTRTTGCRSGGARRLPHAAGRLV